MDTTPSESPNVDSHQTTSHSLPEFVDWLLGVLIALGGLSLIVGGSALIFAVDRAVLEQGIEDETITVTIGLTELTDAETLTVTDTVVSWVGPGLLITGLGIVVFAVGYVISRHRSHRRTGTGEALNSYGTFAVLGAVITAVLSFIPLSAAFGGALAGYLESGESDRTVSVGALAGILPLLPMLVVGLFALGGLVSGLLAIDQVGNAMFVGAVFFLSMVVIAAIGAGLGALGGYIGGQFAER